MGRCSWPGVTGLEIKKDLQPDMTVEMSRENRCVI